MSGRLDGLTLDISGGRVVLSLLKTALAVLVHRRAKGLPVGRVEGGLVGKFCVWLGKGLADGLPRHAQSGSVLRCWLLGGWIAWELAS